MRGGAVLGGAEMTKGQRFCHQRWSGRKSRCGRSMGRAGRCRCCWYGLLSGKPCRNRGAKRCQRWFDRRSFSRGLWYQGRGLRWQARRSGGGTARRDRRCPHSRQRWKQLCGALGRKLNLDAMQQIGFHDAVLVPGSGDGTVRAGFHAASPLPEREEDAVTGRTLQGDRSVAHDD